MGSVPESGRSPGEENGMPLQYSCLENSMDRWAWQAIVHGIAELDTAECPPTTHTHTHTHTYNNRCSVFYIYHLEKTVLSTIQGSYNWNHEAYHVYMLFHIRSHLKYFSVTPETMLGFWFGFFIFYFFLGLGFFFSNCFLGLSMKMAFLFQDRSPCPFLTLLDLLPL